MGGIMLWTIVFFGLLGLLAVAIYGFGRMRRRHERWRQNQQQAEYLLHQTTLVAPAADDDPEEDAATAYAPHQDF